MLARIVATGLSTVVLLAAGAASAQPLPDTRSSFGEKGQLIFGAERVISLIGFQSFKTSSTQGNQTVTDSTSQTSISLLSVNPAGPVAGLPTFYTVPRLGFDYVVIPNFTVGGSAMLVLPLGASQTTPSGPNNTEVTTDGSTTTLFGIAPRAGYIIALSEMFAIWPRAGLSYYSASIKSPPAAVTGDVTTNSVSQWGLNAEGLFVFTPFPHVGLTAGLALDIPITGTYTLQTVHGATTTTVSSDASMWHVGMNAGMVVYF
jgi:hypothetical protein